MCTVRLPDLIIIQIVSLLGASSRFEASGIDAVLRYSSELAKWRGKFFGISVLRRSLSAN